MVLANFNGVLMDKEFWGDPEVFRPDRFIDADGKVNVPDQYLPFGFGKYRRMTSSRRTMYSTFLSFHLR